MKFFTIFFTITVLITTHSCRRRGLALSPEHIEQDEANGTAIKENAEDNKQGTIPRDKEDKEVGRVIYPTEKTLVPSYPTQETQLTHPAEVPDVFRGITIPRMRNLAIPESLLIEMNNIHSADEFLRRFVQGYSNVIHSADEFLHSFFPGDSVENTRKPVRPNVLGRKGLSGETFVQVSKFARCEPQTQVVKLENFEVGIVFWPSCVYLPRCGGCCTSEQLMCSPTAKSTVNITVLQVRYTGAQLGPFADEGMKTIAVEQDDSCACVCKELPDHCTSRQEYRQNECRCVCINQEEATTCQKRTDKFWDSHNCLCKCRNTFQCSSGLFFNHNTCRCEILRISLVSHIVKLLPDSNQAKVAQNETEHFTSPQDDDK